MSARKVVFIGIYRDNVTLCELAPQESSIDRVFKSMLSQGKITQQLQFNRFDRTEVGIVHTEDNLNVVIAIEGISETKVLAEYLNRIRDEFVMKFGGNWKSAGRLEFQNLFKQRLEYFRSEIEDSRRQKIAQIQHNLNETQKSMKSAYEKAITRGTTLEDMSLRSQELLDESESFRRQATNIRRRVCLQKYKWYLLGVGIGVVIVFLIAAAACGGLDFRPKCRGPAEE